MPGFRGGAIARFAEHDENVFARSPPSTCRVGFTNTVVNASKLQIHEHYIPSVGLWLLRGKEKRAPTVWNFFFGFVSGGATPRWPTFVSMCFPRKHAQRYGVSVMLVVKRQRRSHCESGRVPSVPSRQKRGSS